MSAGVVRESGSGEGLLGVMVYADGTTIGTVTDFSGNYSLPAPKGKFDMVFQSATYATRRIPDLTIDDEDQVMELNVTLEEDLKELEDVVVTAKTIADNQIGLLHIRKKSPTVLDAVSAETFTRTGDSDLSVAISRVIGVSVEAGRYVYVRGLGDRYTMTTLNGMPVPGLDPDRNSIQIDLFPTSMLKNVVVYKTFMPSLQGTFTGGLVNMETRSFPLERRVGGSISLNYNPRFHFESERITYAGGKSDWLGFDDGTRGAPIGANEEIPRTVELDPALTEYTGKFSRNLVSHSQAALPDFGLSLHWGNQVEKGRARIGYNFMGNYRRQSRFFKDYPVNRLSPNRSLTEVLVELDEYVDEGRMGVSDVQMMGLFTGGVNFRSHGFSTNLMRIQNGVTTASERKRVNVESTNTTIQDHILAYSQRSTTLHSLRWSGVYGPLTLNAGNQTTWSRVYDPDFRYSKLIQDERDQDLYSISSTQGGGINRFFRDLSEFNHGFKMDASLKLGEMVNVSSGAAHTFKKREFSFRNFLFQTRHLVTIRENDPNLFLEDEQIWSVENPGGLYVLHENFTGDSFVSRQNVYAGYAMARVRLSPYFRFTSGVRIEAAQINYTGLDVRLGELVENRTILDDVDFLPSLNLVFSPSDQINVRFSVNKTLARPSFFEKSGTEIYDPITNRNYIGNLNLESTGVVNTDLRFEYFFDSQSLVSVSGFHKKFDGHIEMMSFNTSPNDFKPRNSGTSTLVGLEMETQINLRVFASQLDAFSLGVNGSLMRSKVDLRTTYVDNNGTTEYSARNPVGSATSDPVTTRPMTGQAPYVLNWFVDYGTPGESLYVKLAYNVQGKSLYINGAGGRYDVYSEPFHSLNMNVIKRLGHQSRVSLKVSNILNDTTERNYYYRGKYLEQFDGFEPGYSFSLKYSYDF